MMKKKKLIIISDCGLQPRQFDYYYVDVLNDKFDFEYWNCSKLLLKKINRVKTKINRPYVHDISSLYQLIVKLKRLPKDTMMVHSTVLDVHSYVFNKIVSHFFDHRIVIGVSLPIILPTQIKEVELPTKAVAKSSKLIGKIKKKLCSKIIVRFFVTLFRHPSQIGKVINDYCEGEIYNMYKWHVMSCLPDSQYYINASNVEKYMRNMNVKSDKRYIVYVDSFFPYHKEVRFDVFPLNINKIAESHFAKINRFFDRIEKENGCPIIIAAHPLANYEENPFNGREIRYGETDTLIGASEAVLIHTSFAISYAILYNKPTALLLDEEYKKSNWCQKVLEQNKINGIKLIDFDVNGIDCYIPPLPEELRKQYLDVYCKGLNKKDFRYNDELLVKNLNSIYAEVNGKNH